MINQMRRFSEIDFLRFLAAFVVVLFHYTFRGYAADGKSPIPFEELSGFTQYGYIGVFLFFIISGFVILKSAESECLMKFLSSRCRRLYPAFIFCCTISYVIISLSGSQLFSIGFFDYLLNLTLFAGFFRVPYVDGVYWSLTVELKFYILVAVLLYFKGLSKLNVVVLIWLAVSFISELYSFKFFRFFFITEWSAFFAGGIVCYLAYRDGWTKLNFLTFVLSCCLGVFTSLNQIPGLEKHYSVEFDYHVVASLVVASFLCLVICTSKEGVFFRGVDFRLLGLITYPLYLLHQNIGYVVMHELYPKYSAYSILFVLIASMLVFSYLVVVFVEAPISKLISRFGLVKKIGN